MTDLIQLCGLWRQKSRKGTTYYTGKLNDTTRIVLFKNDSKEKDSQPDLRLYIRAVETSNEAKSG